MDYELMMDGWPMDAAFFSNEPSDYSFEFDYEQKINSEAVPITEFNDLPWYDQKVDLSLFEETTAPLENILETSLPIDDLAGVDLTQNDFEELCLLISSNPDSYNLSYQNYSNDLNVHLDFDSQVTSPGSSSDFSSPEYELISEASSPASLPFSPGQDSFSEADSPLNSETFDTVQTGVFDLTQECIPSADESCQNEIPSVFVTVCDIAEDSSVQETEVVSLEDISKSMKNHEFVSKGRGIRKVRLSSTDSSFHPYSKSRSRKRGDKSERKKVQNKEAAARYRFKKRIEEQELSGEVSGLEKEQRNLISKKDDLENEIKYLKKLLREMLQKQGKI